MRLSVSLATASLCLAPLTVAQGFVDYGPISCNVSCASQNDPAPGFTTRTLTNEYAHAVRLTTAAEVGGFSVYLNSVSGGPATVQTAIYMEATPGGGIPDVLPVAVGTLTCDGPLDWYTSVINPPLVIPANTLFFIGVDTNAVTPPDVGAGGAVPPAPSFWRRPPFGGTAWAQTGIIVSPLWRIHCIEQGGGVSTMIASTDPTIGTSFDLTIHGSAPSLPAAMLIGFSNTMWGPNPLPFDLSPIGATNCVLLVSPDVTATVLPDPAGGPPTFSLPIPQDPTLAGIVLYMQAGALNPGANPLGMNPSNSVHATIG